MHKLVNGAIVEMTAEEIAGLAALQEEVPAEAAAPPPAPGPGLPPLSPVQLRLGLLAAGITPGMVGAVIAAIPDATEREVALTYWDYSLAYHRGHPLIDRFAAALGLTDMQVDAMWAAAAAIA